jgi:hypothetical protein
MLFLCNHIVVLFVYQYVPSSYGTRSHDGRASHFLPPIRLLTRFHDGRTSHNNCYCMLFLCNHIVVLFVYQYVTSFKHLTLTLH